MGWRAERRRGLWAVACLLLAALCLVGGRVQAGDARGIVFLGDSITHQGDWPRLLDRDDVHNQGVDGDTSAGVLGRLPGVVARRPAKVFLMIGINDLRRGGDRPEASARLLANHERILAGLKAALPQSQIYVTSILPVSGRFYGFLPDNRVISEVNQRLEALAAAKGCAWLDLRPHFADQAGGLDRNLTYDGLHLNAQGYQVWKKALEPLLR